LLKKSHAKPRMYILHKRNPHDLLQLAPEYAYPEPITKAVQAELLDEPDDSLPPETDMTTIIEPIGSRPDLITELPCADMAVVSRDDHPTLAIWKVMRDQEWYLASEVHTLLESAGYTPAKLIWRISELKEAGWFDLKTALEMGRVVKGPRSTAVYRLRDNIPHPVKDKDGQWIWGAPEVAHRARGAALNFPRPGGLQMFLLDLIWDGSSQIRERSATKFESTALIANFLMQMGFGWVVIDKAISRAIDTGWFDIKPNHKFPEAPFVRLRRTIHRPALVELEWTDDQAKLEAQHQLKLASALPVAEPIPATKSIAPIMTASLESSTPISERLQDAAKLLSTWLRITGQSEAAAPELLTAELTIRLKGADLDLEEAKRIVGYFKKNPERMAPGTGDDLIQSTVTVKGVQLTHQELAQVIEKLDKFVSLF
jgi:hypothetical protein